MPAPPLLYHKILLLSFNQANDPAAAEGVGSVGPPRSKLNPLKQTNVSSTSLSSGKLCGYTTAESDRRDRDPVHQERRN